MVISETRATVDGRNGTSVTTIDLITRDTVRSSVTEAANGQVQSFTELVNSGWTELSIANPYTGQQENYSLDDLRSAFAGIDLNTVYVSTQVRFVPDEKLYPSDMVDAMRASGFPESEIQSLLEWERSIRTETASE